MNDQLKKILSYPLFRQAIELEENLYTPGQVEAYLWEHFGLPEKVTNLYFLDVGANDGLFSFEAEIRGAIKVFASDLYKDGIDTMKNGWSRVGIDLLRSYKNSGIEIHDKGIYHLDELKQQFDIVWVNHIVNWLDNIELAIEQLTKVTKGTLYISDGFLLNNEKPLQIVPENMPMRYMYNVPYIEKLLHQFGFKIAEVNEVNNQKVFIDKFIRFPKVSISEHSKIYEYPDLKAPHKLAKTAASDIANSVQMDFLHLHDIGWVYKEDVAVEYFTPSIFYRLFNMVGLESIYLDYLSKKHKKANGYSAFVIKAIKQ
jgi:hypothetical protein